MISKLVKTLHFTAMWMKWSTTGRCWSYWMKISKKYFWMLPVDCLSLWRCCWSIVPFDFPYTPKRLIIKTMQLVKGNQKFYPGPFIKTTFWWVLGSIIAMSGMALVLYEIQKRFPELQIFENPIDHAMIFAGVFTLGLGITIISTFFATQRYLNLKSDAVN